MQTVIMTGITSFIGSHTARDLVNRGCQVSGIIRPNSRHLQVVENDPVLRKTHIVHADLGKLPAPDSKETFLSECKDFIKELGTCDTWFHFAWDSDGEARSRKDPAIEDRNLEMAKKAFYLAQAAGAKCFVFAGSQAEYGNGTHEDPHPVSLYGKAKLAFSKWVQEQLAKKSSAEKMRFIHLRIYSVYG
jgi:UDP-glucose 4-epimerase